MRNTGFSEFIEPCGTSAMPARRNARMPSSSRSATGAPRNRTSPDSIWPGGLIIRRIDRASVDLPEPLSPANPNRSPGMSEKLTSSTARTDPRGCSKATRNPSTSRTGPVIALPSRAAPQARIGDLVEPDGQKEQAEKHGQDHHGRRHPPPPPAVYHRGVEIDPIEGHP